MHKNKLNWHHINAQKYPSNIVTRNTGADFRICTTYCALTIEVLWMHLKYPNSFHCPGVCNSMCLNME